MPEASDWLRKPVISPDGPIFWTRVKHDTILLSNFKVARSDWIVEFGFACKHIGDEGLAAPRDTSNLGQSNGGEHVGISGSDSVLQFLNTAWMESVELFFGEASGVKNCLKIFLSFPGKGVGNFIHKPFSADGHFFQKKQGGNLTVYKGTQIYKT